VADACECGNEPSGSVKCGNFLTSCKPVSCSRRTLHRGVSKSLFNNYTTTLNSISLKLTGTQTSPAVDIVTAAIDCTDGKGKGESKAHPRTGNEGPDGQEM
jgi:hypothetical protein